MVRKQQSLIPRDSERVYRNVDLRGTTNCFNRTWRSRRGAIRSPGDAIWNGSAGQWFLDESRFAVISKRLISPTLVKTIRFSRLKITRSLIVSSNEEAGCAFTPLPPAVLPFLALDISILFKKGREKDSFWSKRNREGFIKYPKWYIYFY